MITPSPALAGTQAPPVLRIAVESAEPVDLAAVPTLRFRARIRAGNGRAEQGRAEQSRAGDNRPEDGRPEDGRAEDGRAVRSLTLHAQVRIAAAGRRYDASSQDRLVEVFGRPEQWGRTLGSLLWTQVTTQVPEFDGGTVADILVGCTYDFDVVAAKYLHALDGGDVPLEFLFSGTIFYDAADGTPGGGLRAARIPWDTEAAYRMPVRVWKDLMARYFPGSAWLRLDRDVFDRLYGFRARNALPSWESAIEALLLAAGPGEG